MGVLQMNGKVLKVVQYNLQFGAADRYVDVFGCFKYKPNGNMYLIYADVSGNSKYNVIYYGSAHIKEKSLLCMKCRAEKEIEVIKEYIFKVTNHQELDHFEMISLDEVEEIEIIASDNLEIKSEIISSLCDISLPKKEEKREEVPLSSKKKKKSFRKFIFIFLFLIIVVSGAYYVINSFPKDTIAKKIICEKEYQHNILEASVEEVNTYNFNVHDTLQSVDTVMTYQFEEDEYQDFIMKGTYYKYLPDENQNGSFKQDDENYMFKVMMKEEIDSSYNKPISYEEVLSYYKTEGYICKEEIEKE